MKAGRTFNNLIAVIFLIAATLLAIYSGVGVSYAATTRYSDVLDDLRIDSTFNIEDYPAVNNDYSLKVIQIAESVDGELFVYVYQPAARATMLVATSVNMSLAETAAQTKFYELTMLNNAGVFQKYRVDGVSVSSEAIRYYNITSIYRAFNNVVDGTNTDNVDEIAYEVAQLWTVGTDENGELTYSMTKPEVVTILDEYASFIRYTSGIWFRWGDATDSHYVAFTANYDIERLYEAEIYFEQRYVEHHHAGMTDRNRYNYGSYKSKTVTLSDIDKGHVKITGLGGTRHSWQRIQRVDDFIKSETSLPSESKARIKDKQWVLRFTETDYSKAFSDPYSNTYDETYYEISKVAILRLYFETNGTVYNLGVVSNKVSEYYPYKDNSGNSGGLNILALIITLIPVIVALIGFLSAIFPSFRSGLETVLKAIGKGLLWLLKGLWWLICLPFRGIAALIRERKATPKTSGKSKAPKSKPRASRSQTRSTSKTKSSTTRKTGGKSK